MSLHGILLLLICVSASSAKHLSFPLKHHLGETRDDLHSIRDNAKRQIENNHVYPSAPYWYGSFDIGDSKNLTMAIDSGSAYIAITTPDVYIPSADSQAENQTYKNPDFPAANHTWWTGYDQTQRNGCGDIEIWVDGYKDTVSWEGLTVKHQRFAVANKVNIDYKSVATELKPPYQGLVGFQIDAAAQIGVGGETFVTNLWRQGQIEERRFGLALGTDGKGQLVLGGIDTSLFDGEITEVKIDQEWGLAGASVIANGSVIKNKTGLFFDAGGPSITSGFENVRTLFEQSGIQAVETQTSCSKAIYGYYPCDSPPRVGFQIGGKDFDIDPAALKWKEERPNNCTAIIVGQEGLSNEYWTVGNPFMEGKYLDHFAQNRSMGFAYLKAPAE